MPAATLTDDQLQLKVRSRRRLIGAVALVLLAVIALPLVFDSAPRQKDVVTDIVLDIRAPESGSQTETKPEQAAAAETDVPAAVSKPKREEGAQSAAEKPAPKPPAKPAEKPVVKLAEKAPAKPVEKTEEPKAKAQAADKPTDKPQSEERKYMVQLGVFSKPENAEQLALRLKVQNVKYSAEKLKSPAGAVRLRTGPYANKAEAEQALARLKLAGFSSGRIVPQ